MTSYHSSRTFLVSGQAQQGFSFFSGSLEDAAAVGADRVFVSFDDDSVAPMIENYETSVRPSSKTESETGRLC
jgi:CMP-2-keto-3-deoxyoctulosonic acid synthetase